MAKTKVAAVATGAGVGAWLGSGIGIAGAFGAMSGVLPAAALGAYLAHRIMKTQFAKDAKVGYATETAKLIARRGALLAARRAEREAGNGGT